MLVYQRVHIDTRSSNGWPQGHLSSWSCSNSTFNASSCPASSFITLACNDPTMLRGKKLCHSGVTPEWFWMRELNDPWEGGKSMDFLKQAYPGPDFQAINGMARHHRFCEIQSIAFSWETNPSLFAGEGLLFHKKKVYMGYIMVY